MYLFTLGFMLGSITLSVSTNFMHGLLLEEKFIHVVLQVGKIRGKLVMSPDGQEVEEYLGIPFAQPPTGKLRYADPQPLTELPTGRPEFLNFINFSNRFKYSFLTV